MIDHFMQLSHVCLRFAHVQQLYLFLDINWVIPISKQLFLTTSDFCFLRMRKHPYFLTIIHTAFKYGNIEELIASL